MALSVMFITQDDPFYVPLFYETFLSKYDSSRIHIDSIVVLEPLGKKSKSKLARQMWNFYGTVDFCRMVLRYLGRHVQSKLYRSGIIRSAPSVEYLADQRGIPLRIAKNINDPSFIKEISERKIDLIISIAASQVFKKEILQAPRYGCINLHSGKLPCYRGMLPNFWQLYHLEPVAGVTVHRMNEKLDDGEIILQKDVTIDPQESLETLIQRTKRVGAELIIEALDRFCSGTLRYFPNDRERATYFTFPSRRDVRQFRKKGLRLL